jgi:hypothetical protein
MRMHVLALAPRIAKQICATGQGAPPPLLIAGSSPAIRGGGLQCLVAADSGLVPRMHAPHARTGIRLWFLTATQRGVMHRVVAAVMDTMHAPGLQYACMHAGITCGG